MLIVGLLLQVCCGRESPHVNGLERDTPTTPTGYSWFSGSCARRGRDISDMARVAGFVSCLPVLEIAIHDAVRGRRVKSPAKS